MLQNMISINIFLERDNKAKQKSIEKKKMLKKNVAHEGPTSIQETNNEHMKAHRRIR